MAGFSTGVSRWMVLSLALAVFVAVPPEVLARGPEPLLVEALIPSRRLPCLWQHAGAGRVLSWTPRAGTHIQPQCGGDGTNVGWPTASRCHFGS